MFALMSHKVHARITCAFFATVLLVAAAGPAHANGAMSLALSTFAWPLWLVYVAVTVVFEGLTLGRWLHLPVGRALWLSMQANALTAILGGLVSGVIGYAFYGALGSQLNPNPFGQTLLLFTLFGIGSGLIEGACWHSAALASTSALTLKRTCGRSLIVHLAAIPLGLAVLLAPSRPYVGLQGQAFYHRTWRIEPALSRALEGYVAEHQALPRVHDYEELLRILQPDLRGYEHEPDLWAAAYVPDYARFDTGQARRGRKWEWNPAANGLHLDDVKPHTLWLARVRVRGVYVSDWCEGLILDGYSIHRTTGCERFGYGN